MEHESFIKRTLALASKAKGMTSPNPVVGALLVKKGRVIAEDYHRKAGSPHAEALVIQGAGDEARSSTLYVSLEPCCHTDKRTPPCTQAIIRAGIRKVVVAMKDPNPRVSGKGIKELEDAGIEVISGILEDKARRLNEFYVKYITTKRPFVILKTAMTLDGKIATSGGKSKWITGEKARRMVHRLRSSVDAVLTAIGTVKADDPELTARVKGSRNPKKIVIDPNLEIPLRARILSSPPETIVVTRDPGVTPTPSVADKIKNIESTGNRVFYFKQKLELNWLMEELGGMGLTSVLIEGGSSLNAHALEDGIVDKVMFFVAPKILGGKDSYPSVGGKISRRLEHAFQLKDISIRRIGEDMLIEGYL